jgi:hypothetical protein
MGHATGQHPTLPLPHTEVKGEPSPGWRIDRLVRRCVAAGGVVAGTLVNA